MLYLAHLHAVDFFLCEADDDDLLLSVLEDSKLGLPRQQVEHLAAVDLEVAAAHLQI